MTKNGHLCLVPELHRKAFTYTHFTLEYDIICGMPNFLLDSIGYNQCSQYTASRCKLTKLIGIKVLNLVFYSSKHLNNIFNDLTGIYMALVILSFYLGTSIK